jgi:hypothetical protein
MTFETHPTYVIETMRRRHNIASFLASDECSDAWQREQLAEELAELDKQLRSTFSLVSAPNRSPMLASA